MTYTLCVHSLEGESEKKKKVAYFSARIHFIELGNSNATSMGGLVSASDWPTEYPASSSLLVFLLLSLFFFPFFLSSFLSFLLFKNIYARAQAISLQRKVRVCFFFQWEDLCLFTQVYYIILYYTLASRAHPWK